MTARLADLPPNVRLAFDITPLSLERFTGISNVVYRLLCHFRSTYQDRIDLFDSGFILSDPIVNEVIEAKSGAVLRSPHGLRLRHSTVYGLVASSPNELFLGLFGSAKTVRDVFQFEAQIIYDLTVLVTPECHSVSTIEHHGSAIERDLHSNDLSICISRATRDDIVTYLDFPAHKTVVVPLGVDPPIDISDRLRAFDERFSVEPYLIVVGTIEPRKNIPLVLELFREHPETVAGLRAVFVGLDKWGPPFSELVKEAGVQDLVASKRILHSGYVSDFEREVLLRKAEFLVFPSLYEGFGLPILEALNVGCPVAASMSSSIPEAGGSAAYYFDPLDLKSLARAVLRLRRDLATDREIVRQRCFDHVAQFSWKRFCREVEAAICQAAIAKIEAAKPSLQRNPALRVAPPANLHRRAVNNATEIRLHRRQFFGLLGMVTRYRQRDGIPGYKELARLCGDGAFMSRRDTFFYTRLESLRGLAALTVAAMHAAQAEWGGATHPLQAPSPSDPFWILVLELLRVLLNGQGMVNLFFVLSGFVLMASIARGPSQIGAATRRFVAARIFRLYPAIWAIIPTYAVVFLLFGQHVALYPADITITQVVSNMLLLDHSMNGAMWSIQMEIIAAPLVILSALISRRWGFVSLIVIVCALFILSFHGAWTRGIGTLSFNPLFCFGLGILTRYANVPIGWLKKYQSVLLFLLAACLFCFARVLLGNSTGAYRWITIAEGCAAAIMIAVIAYRNDANFARPLDWPTLRFYGRISYSLYLLHPLAIAVLWAIPDQLAMALRSGMPDAIAAVGRAAGTILVVTPLAWVCWRYAEVPGIALGRLLERRRVRVERIVVHESA